MRLVRLFQYFGLISAACLAHAQPDVFPDNQGWQLVASTPLQFATYHPQGLTRVDDYWLLSSVEIIERTARYPEPVDGLDRSA